MTDSDPDLLPAVRRVKAAANLRAAVHATLRQGRDLCQQRPQLSVTVRPLLQRLNEIRVELDQLHGLCGQPLPNETAPVWID